MLADGVIGIKIIKTRSGIDFEDIKITLVKDKVYACKVKFKMVANSYAFIRDGVRKCGRKLHSVWVVAIVNTIGYDGFSHVAVAYNMYANVLPR